MYKDNYGKSSERIWWHRWYTSQAVKDVRFTYASETNLDFFLTLIQPVQNLSHAVSQDVIKQKVPSSTIRVRLVCLTTQK